MSYEIIRQASQGMWADAHRPGGLERNAIQAEVIMAEMIALVEKDPLGAAGSWFGGPHLSKYWFMLTDEDFGAALRVHAKSVIDEKRDKLTAKELHEMVGLCDDPTPYIKKQNNPYPYRFELKDVLLSSKEILMQLVADEYFMGGPESTPFTPEAFLLETEIPKDIFNSHWRPDVTVQAEVIKTGRRDRPEGDIYNEGGPIRPKPAEGFREVGMGQNES